jgi:hypothetical protein
MKHAIYALLALILVPAGCQEAWAQSSKIIITSPTTGEQLQVAFQDLGGMNWYEAKKACAELGNNWRLPTKEELEKMYEVLHLKGKGNFENLNYWSSSKNCRSLLSTIYVDHIFACVLNFKDGVSYSGSAEGGRCQVRAVRALDY